MTRKKTTEPDLVYVECVRIWLKEIHPGWTFGAVHGNKMKSIIKKIRYTVSLKGLEGTDEQITASFKLFCQRLPDFFKDKDLQVLDSKYNEIVYAIQTGKKKSINAMSSSQVFGKYGGLV